LWEETEGLKRSVRAPNYKRKSTENKTKDIDDSKGKGGKKKANERNHLITKEPLFSPVHLPIHEPEPGTRLL
jgi:hypothetical protein